MKNIISTLLISLLSLTCLCQNSRSFRLTVDSAFSMNNDGIVTGKCFLPCEITIEGAIGNTMVIESPNNKKTMDTFVNDRFDNLGEYIFELPLNSIYYKAVWDPYKNNITFYKRDHSGTAQYHVVNYQDLGDPDNLVPK